MVNDQLSIQSLVNRTTIINRYFCVIHHSPLTIHETYMRRCLELAEKGSGYVAPNPMVGAVLVNDGEIIGEG